MLKIGHRGASAQAPENTLTAFKKALALGADGVELDVHRSQDGELFVIHDDTVDRTTNGKGTVAQMTGAELRALRIDTHEPIPTLKEVLEQLIGAHIFIEIKHADAALLAAELMTRHGEKHGRPNRLWLISFKHAALRSALVRYPDLQIGASFETLTDVSIAQAHALGARAIIPHHLGFQEAHVTEARALGLKVIVWTANQPSDIARLKALQVDGIISDYPDRLS